MGDAYWIVDPLDGTANYARSIPISAISICLMNQLEPILGVIYDFNNDNLYEGTKFTHALLNDKQIKVSKICKWLKKLTSTALQLFHEALGAQPETETGDILNVKTTFPSQAWLCYQRPTLGPYSKRLASNIGFLNKPILRNVNFSKVSLTKV